MSIAVNQINNTFQSKTASKPKRPSSAIELKEEKKDKFIKKAVTVASTLGIIGALCLIAKDQKIKLFAKEKFWSNLKTNFMKLDFKEKEVAILALGSVGAGLTAGIAFDKNKENRLAKIKESIAQLVGNIGIPILCVSTAANYYNKIKDKIKMPQFKNDTSIFKALNRVSKAIPPFATGTGSLAVGIIVGNFVANKLNNFLFKANDNRKVKLTDFSGHVDDTCLAITLIAKDSKLGDYISRFIPPALIVAGYETGIKKAGQDSHK